MPFSPTGEKNEGRISLEEKDDEYENDKYEKEEQEMLAK